MYTWYAKSQMAITRHGASDQATGGTSISHSVKQRPLAASRSLEAAWMPSGVFSGAPLPPSCCPEISVARHKSKMAGREFGNGEGRFTSTLQWTTAHIPVLDGEFCVCTLLTSHCYMPCCHGVSLRLTAAAYLSTITALIGVGRIHSEGSSILATSGPADPGSSSSWDDDDVGFWLAARLGLFGRLRGRLMQVDAAPASVAPALRICSILTLAWHFASADARRKHGRMFCFGLFQSLGVLLSGHLRLRQSRWMESRVWILSERCRWRSSREKPKQEMLKFDLLPF